MPCCSGCSIISDICTQSYAFPSLHHQLPAPDYLENISVMASNPLFGPDTMNAPWGLTSRLKLVVLACDFFNATKIASSYARIGKRLPKAGNPEPLTVSDLLKYIEVIRAFSKTPNALRITQIVDRMTSTGLLLRVGSGDRSIGGLDNHYLYIPTIWDARRGPFRLVPVLGPEYLYDLYKPGLVHITGKNKEGDAVAGTGLIIHPSFILTCRHVVCDMKVDKEQTFQDRTYIINDRSIVPHSEVDIAVIRVDEPTMSPLQGAIFQKPVVAQTVYTLGYPKLAGLKDATITIQEGAVTNGLVTSLSDEKLFLYSAISRPGNSGGPVVSEDGYVVGLSTVDTTAEYHLDVPFSPHYAGIPAQIVVSAVKSLGLDITLPFEEYE